MHPVHKCTQDCETIHKEIIKKIILVLVSSRNRIFNQSNQSASIDHDNNKNKKTISGNKNNWVSKQLLFLSFIILTYMYIYIHIYLYIYLFTFEYVNI